MSPEYLAGLFDGEGCIDVQRMYSTIAKYKDRLYIRPRVRMCMSDNSLFLGHELHKIFGGHISRRKSTSKNQQNSWSLEWLSQEDIKGILSVILPHLVLKVEQAKLALWWFDNMSGRQAHIVRDAGINQVRQAFCDELKAMKQDPQRLSERATERLLSLMRQSDPTGDRGTEVETPSALAA